LKTIFIIFLSDLKYIKKWHFQPLFHRFDKTKKQHSLPLYYRFGKKKPALFATLLPL